MRSHLIKALFLSLAMSSTCYAALDEAEDWIEDAVKQDSNSAEAHYVRGRVMGQLASDSFLSALSYAKKSKKSFERAVELEPSSVEYQTGLFRFHINAPGIAGGDKKIAKQAAESVSDLDKKAGISLMIDLANSEEDDALIKQLLADAKQQFSTLPDFFFKSGMLHQQNKNYSDAMAEFAKAADLDGIDEQGTMNKWASLYQIGRTAVFSQSDSDKGIQALKRYVKEAPVLPELPSKAWAKFRMANLLELVDKSEQATQIYKRLVKSDEKDLVKEIKKRI